MDLRRSRDCEKRRGETPRPEERRRRFIEAAREAGASENGADFDAARAERRSASAIDRHPPKEVQRGVAVLVRLEIVP